MRIVFLFLFAWVMTIACKNDRARPDISHLVNNSNSAAAAPNPNAAHPIVGNVLFEFAHLEARKGEQVCFDLQVSDFREVISMQYSIQWNKEVMQFQEVRKFNLPYLGPTNFGIHQVKEGILTFVWIENSLKGITLSNNTSIYQVCFQVTGDAGQKTDLTLIDKPTSFEMVNEREELLQIIPKKGRLVIN